MEKTVAISEAVLRDIFKEGTKATKQKIEKAFPNLFISQLEKGVWYKHEESGNLFCWQEGYGVYGFDKEGWSCASGSWSWNKKDTEGVSLASFDEVRAALIGEAKKRGYVIGGYKAIMKSEDKFEPNIDKWEFEGFGETNTIYTQACGKGGDVIFKNGEWAKQKDIARINQVRKEIKDLQIELEQLDNYYI